MQTVSDQLTAPPPAHAKTTISLQLKAQLVGAYSSPAVYDILLNTDLDFFLKYNLFLAPRVCGLQRKWQACLTGLPRKVHHWGGVWREVAFLKGGLTKPKG